jgi:hypothetical protein
MTVNSMYGIKDFVIPGEDPGSILLRCPLQTAVGRNGSRIESGMTVKSVYGMTVFCHPGRRPGIHLVSLPFASGGRAQWIPDRVRDDS